jgi:hypothetical protein
MMVQVSFKAWLKLQVDRGDTVGDFARDAAGDMDAPSGGYGYWVEYLHQVDAFGAAWQEWRKFEKVRTTRSDDAE